MLREMPWETFLEWRAYDTIEPIGGRRGDWQAAVICKMIADLTQLTAVKGTRKRITKTFKPKDFLLQFGAEKENPSNRRSWQEMKMIGQMIALAFTEPNDGPTKKRQRHG